MSRGIALPFRDLGTRWGWVAAPHPSRFTPGESPVPIESEAVGTVGCAGKSLALIQIVHTLEYTCYLIYLGAVMLKVVLW